MLWLAAVIAVSQPVVVKFTTRSELQTDMTAVTSVHVITKDGPFNFREIRLMTFTQTWPDSTSLQQLRNFGIEVTLKIKEIKTKPAKLPDPPKAVQSTNRQLVTITFNNRSEVSTELTSVTSVHVITLDGPYNSKEIRRMTFTGATPDSSSLKQLRDFGIEVSIDPREATKRSTASFGLGLGLDYGGIGSKLTLFSGNRLSLFGGVGYNLLEAGYNAGLEFNFLPHSQATPFISAMYGYNGVIFEPDYSSRESKTYYGPSFGLGVKIRTGRSIPSKNYFSLQLIFPIREQKLKTATYNDPGPIHPLLFSLGFHFNG